MDWDQLSAENTGIVTAIIANVCLSAAINLQKYAKKQIILMALHGLPAVNLRRLWYLGLSMLFASECANFVAFGLTSVATMTPVGVFTIISNCVLPPLVFESHMHTSVGTLISMPGILLLILAGTDQEPPTSGFTLDHSGRLLVEVELVIGIACVFIRSYNPANCSLRLGSNCGLGALMGSHVVTAIKAMVSTDFTENEQAVCLLAMSLTCVLQLILIAETLQLFPVWQVVPHYFSVFIALVYLNSGILFSQFSESSTDEIAGSISAYSMIIVGVWVAAMPHLDLPIYISEEPFLLHQLAKNASDRCIRESSAAASLARADCEATTTISHGVQSRELRNHGANNLIIENDMLREEYARHKHEDLKHREGFRKGSLHLGEP